MENIEERILIVQKTTEKIQRSKNTPPKNEETEPNKNREQKHRKRKQNKEENREH